MLRRAMVGLVILAALAVTPAYGQDVKLEFKFKEGEKYWVEEISNQKQKMEVMGQNIDMNIKSKQLTSYTVKKVTPTEVILAMKIEDVDVSAEGAPAGGMGDMSAKTKGAMLTITMTPAGKVKKVEGFEEFLKKLIEDDEAAQMMKEFITPETLTKGVETSFGFLPEKAVKKGDTWLSESKLPLGPLGNFKLKNNYVYNGKKDGRDEIGDKVNMEFMAPKGDGGALGGLFKVTKSDLKGDGNTTYLFDAQKGRLASTNSSLKMGGTLTIEAGGNEIPMTMSIEISSSTKLLDGNPKGK